MDSDSLFESLYAEDTEGKKLAEFPAINELIDRYPLYSKQFFKFAHFVVRQIGFKIQDLQS